MKLALMFHEITCCFTDCLVRQCTCGVRPVFKQVKGGPHDALRKAAEIEGTNLPDGRLVRFFVGMQEGEDGYVAQFLTDDEHDQDEGSDEPPSAGSPGKRSTSRGGR